MSVEKGTTEMTEAVSKETLVTIPEVMKTSMDTLADTDPRLSVSEPTLVAIPGVANASTDTLVGPEANRSVGAKKFTVEYRIIPTVPICAITSMALLILGILLLNFSVGHINQAVNGGDMPHTGSYILIVFSAFLFTFGIFFACPCLIPAIWCICMCFGIALY